MTYQLRNKITSIKNDLSQAGAEAYRFQNNSLMQDQNFLQGIVLRLEIEDNNIEMDLRTAQEQRTDVQQRKRRCRDRLMYLNLNDPDFPPDGQIRWPDAGGTLNRLSLQTGCW